MAEHKEHEQKQKKGIDKNAVFTVVLAAILVVAVITVVNLSGIQASLAEKPANLASTSAAVNAASQSSSSSQLPASVQSLPDMVGGC